MPDFEDHALRLARMVEEDAPGRFDAIVAVRRGGSYVCDAFCRYFPKDLYGTRYDVALQRPSTRHKKGWLGNILKRLPVALLDVMRMAESVMLSCRRKTRSVSPSAYVEIPADLKSLLQGLRNPSILIIDDAIDSGDTLSALSGTLTGTNPGAIIRIAVMTLTTSCPRIGADYALYRNRTLIRFPWSNDYKKR
ncbi:MAG: hypothetical protein K2K45_10690 [Muribaculaceae bacterium]|nr:hypothetical protein [Muribaculaceae bacterium]MDE7096461.1 hypothetical protein [Muribaculaceae bacterium]